ncbi:MAG: hypothetical protein KC609_14835 [Myxococcales bacterium]|nr:hypothetical protein [Myxococcales bacterium]
MRFRYWRMIGALLALALIAGAGSSFAARKKKDKKGTTRLPWKSKLFLDTKPFQTDFGSVKDLKEYMEKNHKAKIGPLGPRLMYEIHFMAFFKKTQPAQIYVLIFDVSKGKDFVQRFDFSGVPQSIDRFSSAVKLDKNLVKKKTNYLFELKAKTAKGAVLLASSRFQVF